jgi:hypothetical protein
LFRFFILHIWNSCLYLFTLQTQQQPNSKVEFLRKSLNCFKHDMLFWVLICDGKVFGVCIWKSPFGELFKWFLCSFFSMFISFYSYFVSIKLYCYMIFITIFFSFYYVFHHIPDFYYGFNGTWMLLSSWCWVDVWITW